LWLRSPLIYQPSLFGIYYADKILDKATFKYHSTLGGREERGYKRYEYGKFWRKKAFFSTKINPSKWENNCSHFDKKILILRKYIFFVNNFPWFFSVYSHMEMIIWVAVGRGAAVVKSRVAIFECPLSRHIYNYVENQRKNYTHNF